MLKAIFDWFNKPKHKAVAPAMQTEAAPYKVEVLPPAVVTPVPIAEIAPAPKPVRKPAAPKKSAAVKTATKKPAAMKAPAKKLSAKNLPTKKPV